MHDGTALTSAGPSLFGVARALALFVLGSTLAAASGIVLWNGLPCVAGVAYDRLGVSGSWYLAAGLWIATITCAACSPSYHHALLRLPDASSFVKTAYVAIAAPCAVLIFEASGRAGCVERFSSPVLYWRGIRAALTVPAMLTLMTAPMLLYVFPKLLRSSVVWLATILLLFAVEHVLAP